MGRSPGVAWTTAERPVDRGQLGCDPPMPLHLLRGRKRPAAERDLPPLRPQFLEHPCAVEDPRQSVVVGGGDRIKLVIMAAGTPEPEPQKGFANRVDLVIDHVADHLFLVGIPPVPGPIDEERRRHEPVGVNFAAVRGREEIAGDLIRDEAVERQVGGERPHHPVAVAPRFQRLADRIPRERIAVVEIGVAHDVEPATGLSLAVSPRGEQPIDHSLFGPHRAVGEKGLDLSGRGGEPGQIDRHPAQPDSPFGRRRGPEPASLEFGKDKPIEIVVRPLPPRYTRHRRIDHRLVGPPRALLDRRRKRPVLPTSVPRPAAGEHHHNDDHNHPHDRHGSCSPRPHARQALRKNRSQLPCITFPMSAGVYPRLASIVGSRPRSAIVSRS